MFVGAAFAGGLALALIVQEDRQMTRRRAAPQRPADKTLGEIVTEVSEKASLLVREEIELAKAEITEKVTKLTQGRGGRRPPPACS